MEFKAINFQDGGLGNEPIVIFIVPMIFNLICLMILVTKVGNKYGFHPFGGTQSIRPMNGMTIFNYTILLICKIAFESTLCLLLRGMIVNRLTVFICFWLFSLIGIILLFSRVVQTHLKAS